MWPASRAARPTAPPGRPPASARGMQSDGGAPLPASDASEALSRVGCDGKRDLAGISHQRIADGAPSPRCDTRFPARTERMIVKGLRLGYIRTACGKRPDRGLRPPPSGPARYRRDPRYPRHTERGHVFGDFPPAVPSRRSQGDRHRAAPAWRMFAAMSLAMASRSHEKNIGVVQHHSAP